MDLPLFLEKFVEFFAQPVKSFCILYELYNPVYSKFSRDYPAFVIYMILRITEVALEF